MSRWIGSGSTPRARASRSVTVWSGTALPSNAATERGRDGASGTSTRPAGVRSAGIAASAFDREDRGGVHPDDARRGERPARPRQPLRTTIAIGEDEDDPLVRVGRGEMAVEERLEVAVGGGQPRALLDLEGQLAPRGPIRTGRDDQELTTVREPGGDRGRGRIERRVRAHEIRDRTTGRRVERCSTQVSRDRGRRRERARVPDRVAPALVELARLHDVVGQGGARGPARDRDDRGSRPGVPRRREGRVRGRRPALVRDADDQPARRRVERQLERLCGHGHRGRRPTRSTQPGRADRLGQDLGDAERSVLRRAAAGDHDRGAGGDRRGDRACQSRRRPGWIRVPREDPLGERGLRGDHLGHVERRFPAGRRLGRGCPRIGRAGEGSGRIDVGRAHRWRIRASRRCQSPVASRTTAATSASSRVSLTAATPATRPIRRGGQ